MRNIGMRKTQKSQLATFCVYLGENGLITLKY